MLDDIGSLERESEEEPQCSDRVIEDRDMRAFPYQMQLKARNVLEARVGAVPEKEPESDESKRDGNEDNAAPVKAWLVSARWFLFLRIAIRLGHEIESPFLSGAKR